MINVVAYLTCAGYCEDMLSGVTADSSQKFTFSHDPKTVWCELKIPAGVIKRNYIFKGSVSGL